MLSKEKENKLIELYISVDDFVKKLTIWLQEKNPNPKNPTRKSELSESEMMTILIFYHHSGYKCFQYYYQQCVLISLQTYFPKAMCYERFLTYIERILPCLQMFLIQQINQSQRTGIYYIDSKKLVVCHEKRIHSHQVFKDYAMRGKSSTGWFYGFKLHLIINNLGEIVNLSISSGNVADNNGELLEKLFKNLKGECFGDKGYLTKLFEQFYENGLQLITKIRQKMKNSLMPLKQKLRLQKRGVIEAVNDILKSVFDIEHSRHRKPTNALAHIVGGLIAYCFYDNKPSVLLD